MVLASTPWVAQSQGRTDAGAVYERRLGLNEAGFYWDSIFNGTADLVDASELHVDPSRFEQLISRENVTRTWCAIKQRFPLIGATVQERTEDDLFFVVASQDLDRVRHPQEIVYKEVASAQEADEFAHALVTKERQLSNDLVAQVYILRRTDARNTCHVLFHLAHMITDGMANITLKKTFFDILCKESPPRPDLLQRLALSESSQSLYPTLKYTRAKQRWRTAIARVIQARRQSRMAGGHTIPRKVTELTSFTPADSRVQVHGFTTEQTKHIIATCRKHKLTFGNAYPVIGQMATTRILLRRYLRGEITQDEWDWRRREPMLSAGPCNLRPFLDKEWLAAGGHEHVNLSVGFMFFQMPFMPLGKAAGLRRGSGAPLPEFGDLLSRKRFILRSQSVKQQSKDYFGHPLFIELSSVYLPPRLERIKAVVPLWREQKGPPKSLSDALFTPAEQASKGLVFCNGGSSMGNIDALIPREYPINRQPSEKPAIIWNGGTGRLHCRATELYLGASTSRGELRISASWDNNVIGEDMITEWLEEVKKAIEFYLLDADLPKTRM